MLARRWLIALAAFFLVSCATAPTAVPRSAAPEAPGDGAMIIRILPNNAGTNLYFKQWGSVRVARISAGGERTEYVIQPTMDAAARSAVFVASLPPGNYRFTTVPGHACGYICQPAALTPNERFSGFQVQPGRLTDLGTLVQGQSGAGSGRAQLLIEPQPKGRATGELVREFAPSLQPFLERPSIGWDLDDANRALALVAEMALRTSLGVTAPSETLEAGRFIHGSANGAVLSVSPGGLRRSHDVGEKVGVETVLVTRSGTWYSGGEYGLLKASSDKGATWQDLRGNLPFGLVVALLEHGQRVHAAVIRAGRLKVLSSTEGQAEWSLLFEVPLNVNRFWDAVNVRPQLFADGERIVASVPGQQLAVFDTATRQLAVRQLPGSVQYVSVGLDGVYRCRCGSAKVDPYESADQGRTWKPSEASRYFMLPAWRDARFAVRLQSSFTGPTKIATTQDAGASWQEAAEPVPHDLAWFTFSRDGKTIWGMTVQGGFWVSRDEGKSWREVKGIPMAPVPAQQRPPGAPLPPAPAPNRI